jgi:2-polyprenyl-3-methyl-5-hydroxy-6-metoxy-1,4-benzoquinol methylase
VTDYPSGFLPDLRRLRGWPSLTGSLWRSPALVRLTYGELAGIVQRCIGPAPRRVLYVGPGLGHIALELARAGHSVTGVDSDAESVALARRAADEDPFREARAALSYELGEFPEGFHTDGRFDRVLFSRVLHHIPDPAGAIRRAAELLSPGGEAVFVEFAHDRLGSAGAEWVAERQIWLARSGWWPEPVARSVTKETDRVARDWRKDHEEEGLNPLRAMLDPMRRYFRLAKLSWHPYLFWDLAVDMTVPSEREATVARRLRDDEVGALRDERLRGVLFSTTARIGGSAR